MHHNFDDSDSGYDVDMENKTKAFGLGGYKGRIIFLGDGTEVLTDSDDTEMFDNSEEDKDLASQVSKSSSGEDDAGLSRQLPPRAPSPPPRTAKKQEDTKANESTPNTTTSTSSDNPAQALKEEPKEAKPEAAVASKD